MIIFQEGYPEIKDAKRGAEFQLKSFRPSRSQPRPRSSDFHLFLHLKKHLAD
jgi:hypothetical protein